MKMLPAIKWHVIAGMLCACSINYPASAQTGEPAAKAARTAAFERTQPVETEQVVRFGRRPAHVGDAVEQQIGLETRMSTVHRQRNEMREKSQVAMHGKQRRIITTKAVAKGRATAVRVQYHEATNQISTREGDGPNAAPEDSSPVPLPVAGKTYLCTREGAADGELRVTCEDGSIPPMDEYEIVAQHMEMVGRANPFAEFLAGRTLTTGETIEVPKQVAAKLFGLNFEFGKVSRFDLTLEKVQHRDGSPRAVFHARIEAESNDSSQMRMQVEGPFVVEVDTCRAVNVDLIGPIGMSETRGSYSTAYQVIGTGRLKMCIASTYRDAKR